MPHLDDTTIGYVVGPASATDEGVARYDTTTGKLIQNSTGVTITNDNELVVQDIAAATDLLTVTPSTDGSGDGLIVIHGNSAGDTDPMVEIHNDDDSGEFLHCFNSNGNQVIMLRQEGGTNNGILRVLDDTETEFFEVQGCQMQIGSGAATPEGSNRITARGVSAEDGIWIETGGDAGTVLLHAEKADNTLLFEIDAADDSAVLIGPRHYPSAATDPVTPTPAAGDRYYNTALNMEMRFDGSRSKWLSVDTESIQFGDNATTGAGVFYKVINGVVTSTTAGYPAFNNGTVICFGYTRDTAAAMTFEVTQDGTMLSSIASSAVAGTSLALDDDFAANDILALRNSGGSANSTTDVVSWVKVKWRA